MIPSVDVRLRLGDVKQRLEGVLLIGRDLLFSERENTKLEPPGEDLWKSVVRQSVRLEGILRFERLVIFARIND